jgi:hypothetical protein
VKSKSIDDSAKTNVPVDLAGDYGMVNPPDDSHGDNGRVPDAVRAAVFSIAKVGDVAPNLVNVNGRLYIVRLTAKTDPQNRSFQEAERSIRVKLSQEKIREREDALLAQLKAKFPVQIDDQAMASVASDVPDGGFAPEDGGADAL